jgi:hypothetical protein
VPKPELFRRDLTETFGRHPPAKGALQQAINRAAMATEILLQMHVRPKTIAFEADLSHGCLVLEDYPVKNVLIRGVPEDLYVADEKNGLITASLSPHMHKINYQVGEEEYDDLPAYVQELVKKLTQWQLMRTLVGEGEIEVLVQTGRHLRTKVSTERLQHAEALRETEGKRFLQYR